MTSSIDEHLASHREMIPRRFVLLFMKEFCITVVSRLHPQTGVRGIMGEDENIAGTRTGKPCVALV